MDISKQQTATIKRFIPAAGQEKIEDDESMLVIDSTYRHIYLDGTEEQHDSSLVRIPYERRIEEQATGPQARLESRLPLDESVGSGQLRCEPEAPRCFCPPPLRQQP